MKRLVRMMVGMAMAVTLLVGNMDFTCLTAKAVEMEEIPEALEAEVIEGEEGQMPYTSLAQCIISVSGDSDGMYIDITTGAVGTASVIGIKDIKIQKKVWYGWKTVATCSGGETYDRSMAGICITYANAEKDATYRILCIHYADVDGYYEIDNDSGAFVFTY